MSEVHEALTKRTYLQLSGAITISCIVLGVSAEQQLGPWAFIKQLYMHITMYMSVCLCVYMYL